MSNLWLKIGVWAGTDIRTACKEAVNLANFLGIGVEFDFNGVKCFANPGDDPRKIIDEWEMDREAMQGTNNRNPNKSINSAETDSY